MKKFCMVAAGALGAAFAFPLAAHAAPLGAGALAVGQSNAEQSNVIEVQRQQRARPGTRSGARPGVRPGVRPGARPGRGVQRAPRVITRGGYGYWGGHRGYRSARPGYRYYDGWWFPPAAFAAGALLGGVIAGQGGPAYAAPVGLSPQHYAWCEQRYISYRASDNTFQPYQGPRQACVSPYS